MFEAVGLLAYENEHQRSRLRCADFSGSGLKRGFKAAGWNFPKPMEMERRPQVHRVQFPSDIVAPPGPAITMIFMQTRVPRLSASLFPGHTHTAPGPTGVEGVSVRFQPRVADDISPGGLLSSLPLLSSLLNLFLDRGSLTLQSTEYVAAAVCAEKQNLRRPPT
ncbi:hypothetical protein MBM_08270 [Drepanopeziza brunnea f. sp. 'multigermtubi' MB_m1]|uniref:Uncharacterized protein n=1 Tax=Marssonina brunnea f. sp. multigermtubi (strain MB_m1) TaxID=1072389 RepID=K1WMJ8_MARBU|nr:uncharacterized protein MBM_08270 [Drepanopeziza brunnea f. sp. 'multigermtubi' MB_m1]EKD13552.1 hypothetical protein MBM_08270 [Drepanopeziza brunnea f. sp. 'multigermtubi' MB_m1]